MEVSPASPVAASLGFETSRLPARTLGQDDFLKLVVAQLTSQDPLNPQKDTEFIAQMAQFSSLEQTRSMQTDLAGLRTDQQLQQATALIGRTVSVHTPDGGTVTGRVNGLQMADGAPQLVVEGVPFPMSSLVGVTAPSRLN